MAKEEWGPKGAPSENMRLLEVGRFSGRQLQEIGQKHATASGRALYLLTLSDKDSGYKESKRMQAGITVLNQLSIVDRGYADVYSVIARVDLNSPNRIGSHHYYYEIDWINPPVEKPAPYSLKPSGETEKPIYPFKTQRQRELERATKSVFRATTKMRVSVLSERQIGSQYLGYIQVLAQHAEGKEVDYVPRQLTCEEYEDIYRRAIQAGVINEVKDSDGDLVFEFNESPRSPLNPNFVAFLRSKKSFVESNP